MRGKRICLATGGMWMWAGTLWAAPLGTAFTYQGYLEDAGGPVTADCDFEFSLYEDAAGTMQAGSTQAVPGTSVNAGAFTVGPPDIDFGDGAFNGTARWLKISVCCPSGSCTLEPLSPLVELSPAPHALALPGLRTQENATCPNVIGGHTANSVDATVYGATIGGGGNATYANRIFDKYGTVGGGQGNTAGTDDGDIEDGRVATVGGGWTNTASGSYSTVGGGGENEASGYMSTVAGGRANVAGGDYSFAVGRRAFVRDAATAGDTDGDEGTFIWADSTNNAFQSTGPNQFLIRAGGGVGIGKNDPAEQLDVAGNIKASGTITSGSSITIDGTAGSEKITSSADLELHVGDGRALRMETNVTSPNIIGGYSGNSVDAGVYGATIGGGGQTGSPNHVLGVYGTIGGGKQNTAGAAGQCTFTLEPCLSDADCDEFEFCTGLAESATVGGGFNNTASGDYGTVGGGDSNTTSGRFAVVAGGEFNTANGVQSAVGGGFNNTASGTAATVGGGAWNTSGFVLATVGGGQNNTASGGQSTIAGGDNNTASALFSTVPGGKSNTAGGDYSFAAGRRAKANHAGAFVWADSADADCTSTADNEFRICAAGGVEVEGALHASGTITSGSSITIDGTAGSEKITSSADLELHVSDGRALRIETNATSPNMIGGHTANSVEATVHGATISGGGSAGQYNTVFDRYGTVGGGRGNSAGTDDGDVSSTSYGTVGGGQLNTASGQYTTIGGGVFNTASGTLSTVPGGLSNGALGDYSLAAGRRAKANHAGAFVWGDSTDADVTSSTSNQFTARTVGGARFFSNSALTTGVSLAAGGGSWSSVSDRNLKENIAEVDGREVLERLSQVPIATWNYKTQDASIRHIGPMGQDFHAAFGLGDEPPRINTIDADGVALAAIQGLHEIVQDQEKDIRDQQKEIDELRSRIETLEGCSSSTIARAGLPLLLVGLAGLAALRRRNGKGGA